MKLKVLKDLEYGNQSELQKLDLYLPSDQAGPFPLVAFIHGGAWESGDKSDGQELDWLDLVNSGYAVASINYRLNNEVKHPEGLLDCRRAINYLANHANEFNIDPNRIAVTGNSAGGYYALMLATTQGNPNFEIPNENNANIKSCIALYAPTDFNSARKKVIGSLLNRIKYSVSIAITENYFGKSLQQLTKKELQEASPTHYISKDLPPLLLQHGDDDFVVPYEQAEIFYAKANRKGAGQHVFLEKFNGANHIDPMFSTPENKSRIRLFLDENLKKK